MYSFGLPGGFDQGDHLPGDTAGRFLAWFEPQPGVIGRADHQHPDHVDYVLGFVDRASAVRDKIIRGGKRYKDGAIFVEPTLIAPKSNDAEIVQTEVFGPVLTFQTFAPEKNVRWLPASMNWSEFPFQSHGFFRLIPKSCHDSLVMGVSVQCTLADRTDCFHSARRTIKGALLG